MTPWKLMKNILRLIFMVVGIGLALSITANIITPWIQGKELEVFLGFLDWLRLNWILSLELFSLWLLLSYYAWMSEKNTQFMKIWELVKPAKKLRADDFRIQKFSGAYLFRNSNAIIEESLRSGNNVLITGKPKSGKTRAAFRAIKILDNVYVIKPKPERIEIEGIRLPYNFRKRRVVCFLDDLDYFIETGIESVIEKLRQSCKHLTVVATCRSGLELHLATNELSPLINVLTKLELEDISEDEGRELAKAAGLKWKVDQFDGTPGSVILDLQDMRNKYSRLGESKIILKAMKLLREGGIVIYDVQHIKDVCLSIFEVPQEKLRRYNWDEIVAPLVENGFITTVKDTLYIYPAYLDSCVYDYEPKEDLAQLIQLIQLLVANTDFGGLLRLGYGFFDRKEFEDARVCFTEAFTISPHYVSAHNALGLTLTKLAENEEAIGRPDRAESLYKEAAQEYGMAISHSGGVFTFLADEDSRTGFLKVAVFNIIQHIV